ncbi:MAG: tryptophan synthase, alpha subunit [Clostridiales bacterium]|jgi:tryptophan synthase alpha chain|nr:tryptophan synthase, alpha subunit [Clostridiales bacterium]
MNRIDAVFNDLRKSQGKAVIPYVTCGYPSLDFTKELISVLAEAGADLIEIGVPYSDPVADGPTIQKASARALTAGITLDKIFRLVEEIRGKCQVPLIMMTYYNPIYVTGVENFIKKAAAAGVDGLIIPDLPVEEAGHLSEVAERSGLRTIFLVAPTSTSERIEKIAGISRGFIYCVSVTGVTGARKEVSEGLEDFLKRIRLRTELPLAVGFGISSPETACRAAEYADGVIVGSALIQKIEENVAGEDYSKALQEAAAFIKELKGAVDSKSAPNDL